MIKQFRNFNLLNIIILFILVYILRVGLFIDVPTEINTGFSEMGSRLLIKNINLPWLSPFFNIVVAGLTIYIQAILFNTIINEFGLLGKTTLLPALIYVIVSSVFTPFLFLSPALICNFLLLLFLYRILIATKNPVLISTMFDLGMLVAIGTIVYFPFILIFLILWIALLIFRAFNWREWIASIMGYLTVVLFLAVYYYWNNKLGAFYEIWKPLTNTFPVFIKIQLLDYIVLFPIALGLLLGFFQLRENFYKSFIQVRKTFQLLFFLFIVVVISFYIKQDYRINHFLLAVIPTSTLLSYYFLHATKRWFYETIFLLITGFIIYFQFV